MKQTGIAILTTLLLLAWAVLPAMARPGKRYDQRTKMCRILNKGQLDWDSEPWGRGGKRFREVCKSCHSKNNDQGAPFLWAESYTAEAWNRIFAKRRKKCARNGSWDKLSEEDLLLINDYLYRNGDWTYDPNDADSCG